MFVSPVCQRLILYDVQRQSDVGEAKTRRLRIPVGGDHEESQLLRGEDGGNLHRTGGENQDSLLHKPVQIPRARNPPSMTRVEPVVKLAASEARYTAPPTNSSTFPKRFMGVLRRMVSRRAGSESALALSAV